MSYRVRFRDHSEIILPDEAGEKLKEHILTLKKPANLDIGGELYNSGQIISVTRANLAGSAFSDNRSLSAPKYSCAQFSIQLEINKRAKAQKNWATLVRDPSWREKTRKDIHAEDPKKAWCDHHANTHACQPAPT